MPDNTLAGLSERIKVDIIEQKMKAVVLIKAPQEIEDEPVTLEMVLNALDKAGVKYGINQDAILDVVSERRWGELFTAALGTPAATGEDATIEYHFLTYKSLKPQVSEDGHIDYKEVNVVNSVVKDNVLMKKNPATAGEKGMNVRGEEIPGKLGKDVSMSAGAGTYKDPSDDTLIKAAIDGIVFFNQKNNSVEVQKLYVISGSVDYSTGNVNVKSSIEVKADIKPGFSVTTPYNVSVRGTVEHASITCDGNLTVKEGIVGDGKHVIKTGGDIHSGYINNQIIKCGGSVYAATEIRNSIIECEDEVVLTKNNGLIIGGKIIASNKINTPTIGNMYNVPTELEVGVNFEFKEKYFHKVELKNGVLKQIEEFRKKIEVVNSKPADLGTGSMLKNLKAQLQDAVDQLEKLKRGVEEIARDYYNIANPTISVSKTVFPGTIIKIKHAIYEVKEEMSHVMFKLVDEKIECTKLK